MVGEITYLFGRYKTPGNLLPESDSHLSLPGTGGCKQERGQVQPGACRVFMGTG